MFGIIVTIIHCCLYIIQGCGIQSESCFGWKTFDDSIASIDDVNSSSDYPTEFRDDIIDVRFLILNDDNQYIWSEYRNNLDNIGCDDYQKNNIDWYKEINCTSNVIGIGLRMNNGNQKWICDIIYFNDIIIDTFYDTNNNGLDSISFDYGINIENDSYSYYAIDLNGNILSNNESYIITTSPTIYPTASPLKSVMKMNSNGDNTISLVIITVVITSSICCICWVFILIFKHNIPQRNKLKHNKTSDNNISTMNIVNHSSIKNAIELVTAEHVKAATFEGGITRPSHDTNARHKKGELSTVSDLYIQNNTSNTQNTTIDGDV